MYSYRATTEGGQPTVEVPLRGRPLLNNSIYNKGTAFPPDERRAFGLEGLLPSQVSDLDTQAQRSYGQIARKTDPLEKYIGLASLQDRNETLFYRVLADHLEELLPIVYTPTVGLACQQYSHIFRRARGLWITPEHQGRVHEVLDNAPFEDVRLIVVTDNERILGLGDQGAGGMGIPIGKLALYSVGAGIHPTQTLPISLDVGTDNQALLDDELYIGWRHPRLRGERYDALVEELVEAVKRRFPQALLQWEDFKKGNAFALLDRYRERVLSFNDDIQGTAAVALAGVLAACLATRVPLEEQRIAILGAGAAGIGIARQLRDALSRAGVSGDELVRRVAVLDSRGLLVEGDRGGDVYKDEFAWPRALAEASGLVDGGRDLDAVVEKLRPTVLIGTSGQPGVFSEALIRKMASYTERPVVFPFSNPTDKSEAIPDDLVRWTKGRALIATGSPFEPVSFEGRSVRVSQGNNVYVFPGTGLGALAAGATRVTDAMFTVAAEALASRVPPRDLEEGALFPPLRELRSLSRDIAVAVAMEAVRCGCAPAADEETLRVRVEEMMWTPAYARYVAAE